MDRKSQSLGPRLKFQLPQCWCPNPVESSSWCCDPWSSGRAYGLVTGIWDLTLASGLVHGLASRANWLGGQKGDLPLPTHRICAT